VRGKKGVLSQQGAPAKVLRGDLLANQDEIDKRVFSIKIH